MLSAGTVTPGNNGQTDVGRGMLEALPVTTMMSPAGREYSVKGKLTAAPNDNSPAGLHRRVPSRGVAINGLVTAGR